MNKLDAIKKLLEGQKVCQLDCDTEHFYYDTKSDTFQSSLGYQVDPNEWAQSNWIIYKPPHKNDKLHKNLYMGSVIYNLDSKNRYAILAVGNKKIMLVGLGDTVNYFDLTIQVDTDFIIGKRHLTQQEFKNLTGKAYDKDLLYLGQLEIPDKDPVNKFTAALQQIN